MYQLAYNIDFTDINDKIDIYTTFDEIPLPIKEFIKEISTKFLLYNSYLDIFYCSKCYSQLEDYTCPKCQKTYSSTNHKFIIETSYMEYETSYYFFDYSKDDLILYEVQEKTYYDNPISFIPYKTSRYYIKNAYRLTPEYLTDCLTGHNYYFKDLVFLDNDSYDFSEEDFQLFNLFYENKNFIYTSNFTELIKNNMYKYSNINLLKEYLDNNVFTLATLTYYPLYCKQFEYLVKLHLYNLACFSSPSFKKQNSFKAIFGVDKKYLSFMQEYDININILKALQLYPCTDISLLTFISRYLPIFKDLITYINPLKLQKYMAKEKMTEENIYEYEDYITSCAKLKLNLKDAKVLYPKDFFHSHDQVTAEVIFLEDKDIDKKLHNLANIYYFNIYEDDKYIIFPADSIKSLIDESTQMSNCVRSYGSKVANNECQIYFMRNKKQPQKSLVTIEVKNGSVIQAKTKYNNSVNDEMQKVIKKFAKSLLSIEFDQ